MGRWVLWLVWLGLLAPAARAEVDVRVSDERVDVTATAAPLADVLDRLAAQIGMEIVYEGKAPRQRVTLALEGRSPAEAVQGILEGQGLNYALVADPSGRGVQTLLMAGPAGKGASLAPARPTAPRARRPIIPPGAGPEAMDPDFAGMYEEEPFDDSEFMDEEDPAEDPGLTGEPSPGYPDGHPRGRRAPSRRGGAALPGRPASDLPGFALHASAVPGPNARTNSRAGRGPAGVAPTAGLRGTRAQPPGTPGGRPGADPVRRRARPGFGARGRTMRGCPGRKSHSLYFVRPLKTRRLSSALVLATPWIPPRVPAASRGLREGRGARRGRGGGRGPRRPGGAATGRTDGPDRLSGPDEPPRAVLRHGVLVLAAQELPLDQHLEGQRKGVSVALLVPLNGVRDLPSTEDQLLLAVVLHHVAPRRHRRRHQDQHDRHRGEESHERVAGLAPSSAPHGFAF